MKILVVGASGLLGGSILRVARHYGHTVSGTRRTQNLDSLIQLDIAAIESCERLIDEFQPNAVVCCAAWPWVDGCEREPERAMRENCQYPVSLAKLSVRSGIHFVYVSTSYIFDGTAGPYSETDQPKPINLYGKSKLAGESEILDISSEKIIIARTMGVYGHELLRKNFVYQVLDALSTGKRMKVPYDQLGNITPSSEFAKMLLTLLAQNASGIWNIAGPEHSLSRKDFALRIAEHYSLDTDLFDFLPTADLNQIAKRPLHAGLSIEKITTNTKILPSSWEAIPE